MGAIVGALLVYPCNVGMVRRDFATWPGRERVDASLCREYFYGDFDQ